MVKLAIVALAAACLAAAVVGQRPQEQPWGGLVEEDGSDVRQSSSSTSLGTLLANLISSIITPLFQNIATGITNAITATFANRTLRYIPVPYVPEPIYRLPPRPYGDDYPTFYREPSSRPATGPEPYRRRPTSVDSTEHSN